MRKYYIRIKSELIHGFRQRSAKARTSLRAAVYQLKSFIDACHTRIGEQIASLAPRTRRILFAFSASLVMASILSSFQMNIFEAYLYDLRVQTAARFHVNPSSELHLLTLEQESNIPPMEQLIGLFKKLQSAPPKVLAVVLDIKDLLDTNLEINPNLSVNQLKLEFLQEAYRLTQKGTRVILGTNFGIHGEVLPPEPLNRLEHAVSIIHKDNALFADDKVVRRAWVDVNGEKTLHTLVAEVLAHQKDPDASPKKHSWQSLNLRGQEFIAAANAHQILIHYTASTREDDHPYRYNTVESFLGTVENQATPVYQLRDKVILLGTLHSENANDYVYTPFSKTLFNNPKLVVHAQIIDSLAMNQNIFTVDANWNLVLTILLATAVIMLVFETRPSYGIAATIATATAFVLLGSLLYGAFAINVGMAKPLVAIFFAYYIFVPYRLMLEYQKSADFQQQHNVLLQVDELKRNFMNLITHDLKTPVARIQGMAEILGRNGADEKIVSQILASTTELDHFVTSVLELSRIESNRVKLTLVSKDINKIIETCVHQFRFEAQKKKMNIELKLEPLFPLQLDPSLISKVLANILDNSLKYSPEGSTILIESKESKENPGFIEASISDNGPGIPKKSLDVLFTKFSRGQTDSNLLTKGYGLGLYLSKYFVDLHHGALFVSSKTPEEDALNHGTKFSILLPERQTDQLSTKRGEQNAKDISC